jgi:nucleolar complex protein 3
MPLLLALLHPPPFSILPPPQVNASKEVQALRDFEAALLKAYQSYLKTLVAAAGGDKPNSTSLHLATARVAVKCMAQLLLARPGFNYFSDLLQALVPRMVHWDREVAAEACGAVQALLQTDTQVRGWVGV